MNDKQAPIFGYVTKYALTAGIQAKTLRPPREPDGLFWEIGPDGNDSPWTYYTNEGRDWHRTVEAAVSDATRRQKAKLASLRKQIAKLEALDFTKSLTGKVK